MYAIRNELQECKNENYKNRFRQLTSHLPDILSYCVFQLKVSGLSDLFELLP